MWTLFYFLFNFSPAAAVSSATTIITVPIRADTIFVVPARADSLFTINVSV